MVTIKTVCFLQWFSSSVYELTMNYNMLIIFKTLLLQQVYELVFCKHSRVCICFRYLSMCWPEEPTCRLVWQPWSTNKVLIHDLANCVEWPAAICDTEIPGIPPTNDYICHRNTFTFTNCCLTINMWRHRVVYQLSTATL